MTLMVTAPGLLIPSDTMRLQGGCHLRPEGWPPVPPHNDCSSTACYSACNNIGARASCSDQASVRRIVMA